MKPSFSIKSILAVSLLCSISIMSSTASAWVTSTTVSGCSLYQKSLGQCTVYVDGLLKGLGNVNKNPTAFKGTMWDISGLITCFNPAGNAFEGQGVPFDDLIIPVESGSAISPDSISKNGKTLSEIAFHDPEIAKAVNAGLTEAGLDPVTCQNDNWIPVVVVTSMQIMGQQISDPDTSDSPDPADPESFTGCYLPITGKLYTEGCDIDDTLRVACRIQDPYFADPASALGEKYYDYVSPTTGAGNCDVICHDTDPEQCNATSPPF